MDFVHLCPPKASSTFNDWSSGIRVSIWNQMCLGLFWYNMVFDFPGSGFTIGACSTTSAQHLRYSSNSPRWAPWQPPAGKQCEILWNSRIMLSSIFFWVKYGEILLKHLKKVQETVVTATYFYFSMAQPSTSETCCSPKPSRVIASAFLKNFPAQFLMSL